MTRGPRAGRLRAAVSAGLAAVLSAVLLTALPVPAAVPASAPERGSPGVGDPYFPLDGNGGIDVQHYAVRTRYDFSSGRLSGRTTLTLTATAELARFNLDFLLPVSRVEVDGRRAAHRRTRGHELVITPPRPLRAGQRVRVRVEYAGFPGRRSYAGESNWLADRHEVVTMNEPHMAPWWFPSNDHPTDKATLDLAVTVPRGRQVVANGDLVSRRTRNGRTTWRWRAREPMATYLAFFAAGRFRMARGVHDGLPWVAAVSRRLPSRQQATSMRMLRRSPALVRRLEADLGPYPFSSTGGLVTSLGVGFALENQTRPTYPALGPGSTSLLVHELAHQWFGNSVSVARWRDIWLNEGSASFMEHRHRELTEGRSAQQWLESTHRRIGARDPFWHVRIGDPGRGRIFDHAIYLRGAMTFQALRHRIGEDDFWTLLRTWLSGRKDGNGSSAEFEALAGQVSGEDLSGFFEAWLRTRERPAATAENGLA